MCSATIKRPISLRSLGKLQDRIGGKRLRVDPKIVQVSDVVDPKHDGRFVEVPSQLHGTIERSHRLAIYVKRGDGGLSTFGIDVFPGKRDMGPLLSRERWFLDGHHRAFFDGQLFQSMFSGFQNFRSENTPSRKSRGRSLSKSTKNEPLFQANCVT